MKTRIISGACMVPLLGLVYLGGYWLSAFCFLLGILGVREFLNGFRNMGFKPSEPIAFVSIFVLYAINLFWPMNFTYIMAWLAASVIACQLYLFHVEEHKAEDTLITMMGIVYVIFFSFHIVLVDQTGPYSILIWTVILAAAGTDIFAYFIGSALGKHKLCPHLSPKKSIEGAIGGVIGSVALCALFAYLFAPYLMLHFVLIGLIGSPFAQCGDLAASAYKRKMGIKDYSNLIPGHGGIMDRIDSMLFMAPFVFYYIQLVLVR